MSNSYGVQAGEERNHAFGVYDTVNGEWSGTWFESREEAAEWVQTQDDKDTETGADIEAGEGWTEGIYSVLSTTDDEDEVL
jgi:hypothetical protein